MHPSPTRAQEYQMDDPCYHIGGDVPPIDIKIKNPKCGISRSPTQYKLQVVSRLKYFIKNLQVMSRSTHKWYPIGGTHEDSKCSRNGFYW